jgi:hypothetical protein
MDAADCVKEAEKCKRLASECGTEIGRAFFRDAAAHWRQMALDAEHEEPPPPSSLKLSMDEIHSARTSAWAHVLERPSCDSEGAAALASCVVKLHRVL